MNRAALTCLFEVARKDVVLILRDRGALLFTILVPIAVVTIVAESLGDEAHRRILFPIVNEDEGPVAEVLIELLGERVTVLEVERREAERMVGKGNEAAAALVIPEKTSKRYLQGRPTTLTLLTDPARPVELSTVKAFFLLADRDATALADPLYEELLVLEEQNLTGNRVNTDNLSQTVPGFSIMFVLMGVLFGIAFSFRDEHEWGTDVRLELAPVSGAAVLGGKLLARFALGLAQLLLLFGFGRLIYGVSLGPSLLTFLILSVSIVFSMTGFSLLVTSFVRTREQIIPLGLTVVMLVCALGGCWWPLFVEPPWLQQVARITLTAWAMEGIADLALRERHFSDIALGVGVLLLYGSVCLAAGAWLRRPAR
jgi:ABC-2 type transport system permease protein